MAKKLFICKNLGCDKCFIVDQDENKIIENPGNNALGEAVCPSCQEPLTLYEVFIDEIAKEKQDSRKKLVKLIAAIAVGVVVIGSLIFLFTGKSGDEKPATQAEVVPEVVQPVAVEEEVAEPLLAEAPKQTQAAAPAGTQTKNFPNGDRYVGEVSKGQMHGLGTYYYAESQRISDRDRRERIAEAGDYIVGEWFEGKFVQGRLYDKDGNQKEVIIIGR